MNLRKIRAIFWKQIKVTLKNKAVLIQFLMFPILGIIMEMSTDIEGLADNYFIMLFATMYIGMAPLTSIAAIISEEKESNTLRVLIMSNVKANEYLVGVGSYVVGACSVGAIIFGVTAGYTGVTLLIFILIMMVGIILSTLLGSVIGIGSKNQMASTSIVVPVMIVFSFLPMISMFNETIAKVSKYTYTQQINTLLSQVEHLNLKNENALIIAVNMLIFLSLFGYVYGRSRFNATGV